MDLPNIGSMLGSGFVSGIIVETFKRFFDKRLRQNNAKSKLVAEVTKLEFAFYHLEEIFNCGKTTNSTASEWKALDEFALVIGEARMDLPEPIIGAAMLVYSELYNELYDIDEGRYPRSFLPAKPDDIKADPIEELLKALGATAPRGLWRSAKQFADKLPKVDATGR